MRVALYSKLPSRLLSLSPFLAVLLIAIAVPNRGFAHDLGSGKHMGFPPAQSVVDQQLLRLFPASLDQSNDPDLKGVLDRVKMWPQDAELIVCFLSGDTRAHARVASIAAEWMNYANLQLNFGEMTQPRKCSGNGREHIKIGFVGGDGYWSYVGVDSWHFPQSMNLEGFGLDVIPPNVTDEEFRGIILHEFGHAIGLQHEHQSPSAKCDQEFNAERVAAWAKRLGWSPTDVSTNLKALEPRDSLLFTRHDKNSVMHYSLPSELFPDGKNNRCWVPKNNKLSDGDKKFISGAYPPRIPNKIGDETRRSANISSKQDRDALEANYRADIQRAAEKLLEKAQTPASDRKEISARLRQEIDKLRDHR